MFYKKRENRVILPFKLSFLHPETQNYFYQRKTQARSVSVCNSPQSSVLLSVSTERSGGRRCRLEKGTEFFSLLSS
jgi:hypothetical protein